jgi:hypothetical protein
MKKLFFSLLILGFSSPLFAATIDIVSKDKIQKIDAIRFDICPNGKIAYAPITNAKNSENTCGEKKYVDHKSPITNFRNGDVSIVKAGPIQIKSPNEAFADVLTDRLIFLQSQQPVHQKRLIGIAIQNEKVGDEGDESIQAQIFLFEEGATSTDPRKFYE